jgi:DNA modification methylase
MIGMWDTVFAAMDPETAAALASEDSGRAFELMHCCLDPVWHELYRVLVDGGIACINIGDATRTIGGDFQLFPNHMRIIKAAKEAGFSCLPLILWRKQTNAPTKFMGSGMLPPGAYVTLEHEYILIFRKGGKRDFTTEEEKSRRRRSAYFWEERNRYFSDLWDLKGTRQELPDPPVDPNKGMPYNNSKQKRSRSGSFPFEIPYRLISMYSIIGDTVIDPFFGLGTTAAAAMSLCRNSIGCEVDNEMLSRYLKTIPSIDFLNEITSRRLEAHETFIYQYQAAGKTCRYSNKKINMPVVTRQETDICFYAVTDIERRENELRIAYRDFSSLQQSLFS